MLPRTLEPEVMDTAEEAADYDAMDHSAVNRVFVSDLVAAFSGQPSAVRKGEIGGQESEIGREGSDVLDVGTGTALIPIELVRWAHEQGDLRSGVRRGQETGRNMNRETGRNFGFWPLPPDPWPLFVTGIDLADEMLKLGRSNVERAGCSDCIALERVDAKRMPYADGAFDAVMSNSIVHHIPEPGVVFAEMWRVLKPGGLLFVRDLLRPETKEEVERIVTTYARDESPRQQQLFRQSLHAALTVEEVQELLLDVGICRTQASHPDPPSGKRGERVVRVRQTSDRHWTIVARRDEPPG